MPFLKATTLLLSLASASAFRIDDCISSMIKVVLEGGDLSNVTAHCNVTAAMSEAIRSTGISSAIGEARDELSKESPAFKDLVSNVDKCRESLTEIPNLEEVFKYDRKQHDEGDTELIISLASQFSHISMSCVPFYQNITAAIEIIGGIATALNIDQPALNLGECLSTHSTENALVVKSHRACPPCSLDALEFPLEMEDVRKYLDTCISHMIELERRKIMNFTLPGLWSEM